MKRITLQRDGSKWYTRVYLRSFRWRILRRVALWLAGGQCRLCENEAREVHHRSYMHAGRGGVVGAVRELLDLTPLCGACHEVHHANRS